MANTTNLNMVKPAGTDHALISVINSNMDIIDGAVGALPSGSTLQGEIDSANTAIGTVNSALSAFEGQMCIVQTTDTATQNISEGQYVLWKGTMTKATQFIGTGGGLNSTRLPAVTGGGLNDLNGTRAYKADKRISTNSDATFTFGSYYTSAIIFATSGTDGILYIYSNGWLVPVKTTSSISVTLSSNYLTVTVHNGTASNLEVGCFSTNQEIVTN